MTKSIFLLFSLIFSMYAFADRNNEGYSEDYALPVEEWSDSDIDSDQVFAILDEELNNEEYEEYKDYEEVAFDQQGRITNITRETNQYRRYETQRDNDYFSHASHWNSPRRTTRSSHRYRNNYRNSYRNSHRRRHRRRPPVVVVPPPIIVTPPLVSNICRRGHLGNGYHFCYFVDGRPRIVGSACSCYLRNAYTGERIFFRGRVSTW